MPAISQLNGAVALTAPASADVLPITDVSDTTEHANGTTKKITWANLFASPTITTPTISGIYTADGANITTANAMAALAIDVAKGLNTKSVAVDSTFTFSATPAANTWFTMRLTNSDTAAHVITIPSSYSMARQATITTFTQNAASVVYLIWCYDGATYRLFGEPVPTFDAEATIASATTTDLGAQNSVNVSITGTTTITGLGTAPAGLYRQGRFTGALTLTHNATSLILPGAASITTAAGDRFGAYSLGAGNWVVLWYTPVIATLWSGKSTIAVNASAMTPSATGGSAVLATVASAANQPDIQSLDFDTTTEEYAQFSIPMPKKYNNGTLTFAPIWSHAATTVNFGVVWSLQAVAISDADAIAVAYGTAVTSTDTGGTTNTLYIGPESAAMTVAGTPAAGDVLQFRIFRTPANASDTMAIDARLHGIRLFYTSNASTDA